MPDVDEALIPLDVLRERLGLTERTLRRRLVGVDRQRYGETAGGVGRQFAVKWGDIKHMFGGGQVGS